MPLPLDFALEGFRILRARPKLIAFWGVVSLFGYGLCVLILVALLGPYQPAIAALKQAPADSAASGVVSAQILAALAACVPVYALTSAVLNCAICRASLGEEDDNLGYLRFGLRELQVGLVIIVTGALLVAVCVLVTGLWMAMRLGENVNVLGLFVAFGAALWLRVKLSLNVAQSFATRRIDIFGSFSLTRDQFAPLLAGYIVAFGLALVVGYLCEEVINGTLAAVFTVERGTLTWDASSLAAFLSPPRATALVLALVGMWPQLKAIEFAAPVAAYNLLKGASAAPAVQSAR